MSSATKRPAEVDAAPEAKRAEPSPTACAWTGSGGSGCTWGSGGGASFASVGSGGGGFAAVASSGSGFGGASAGSGFGAVASAGGGFGSADKPPPASTSFGAKPPAPGGGAASDPDASEAEEAPTPVEVNTTGEENEDCSHRVRAKLFRLEARAETPRREREGGEPRSGGDARGEEAKGEGDDGKGAAGADGAAGEPAEKGGPTPPATKPAADAGEPAAEPKSSDGAGGNARAEAAEAGEGGEGGAKPKSALNPLAAEFVPAKKAAEEGGGATDGEADSAEAAEPLTRWVERGVGSLRLLVPKRGAEAPAHPRLVMRVEHVGRLILNVVLPPSTAPAARVADTSIRLVVVEGGSPQSYLLRVKTAVEAEQLLARLNATIPKEGG